MASEWIGTASTALVGIAGIFAAIWVSGRDHQRRRSDQALTDRRQIYQNLFTAADGLVAATRLLMQRREREPITDLTPDDLTKLITARMDFNTAMYQLALSAPQDVVAAAEELRRVLRTKADQVVAGARKTVSDHHVRVQLLNVMRVDLGASPMPPEVWKPDEERMKAD
ncbi:hypothetical protein [Catellatospora tritici]|uniref:hypothetical protein n=1 Tax=Catellatospora tritici TaxID=2851566 RepID=UPI001C2D685A|nr:hypothetical protein [Catellatospora tritici]MBV1855882.1 hypothetical protein [Catellatospora tritici]